MKNNILDKCLFFLSFSHLEVMEVAALGQFRELERLELFEVQVQLVVELDGAVVAHALGSSQGLTGQLQKHGFKGLKYK